MQAGPGWSRPSCPRQCRALRKSNIFNSLMYTTGFRLTSVKEFALDKLVEAERLETDANEPDIVFLEDWLQG
jgi:hypothetical protein